MKKTPKHWKQVIKENPYMTKESLLQIIMDKDLLARAIKGGLFKNKETAQQAYEEIIIELYDEIIEKGFNDMKKW